MTQDTESQIGNRQSATEDLETALLLEAVYRHSGYDFREYAPASIRRRVHDRIRQEQVRTISELQARVLHDPAALNRFLEAMSVSVTAIFRDPAFYASFREAVVPQLRTYPFTRLWVAGCATGEEAYSIAILLSEEGLYGRCKIYATDFSETALAKAKAGVYSLGAMKEYTANYQQAGGKVSFSEYYTAQYGNAILREELRRNILFSQHNLATDGSFNEFQVVLCRNVLIYFSRPLAERVLQLIADSLPPLGYLCLGAKENLKLTRQEDRFREVDGRNRIFRKTGE
jgi:chemotaxis protein methyltransferase CheR